MSTRLSQFQAFRNPNAKDGGNQAQRRQDALARQREERQQAFTLARTGFDKLADALDFSSDEEEQEGQDPDERFNDADQVQGVIGDQDMQAEASSSPTTPAKTSSVPKAIKKKWRAYANRLMQGETLDYAEGLPSDLSEEWLAIGPVPQGKRCMAVTFSSTRTSKRGRATNTLLLARQSGRPLSRHLVPALPPDCVLDCIYSETLATLFVLDLLRWKRQSMTESEAEFRVFWRDSKLSEMGPQPLPSIPSLPPLSTSQEDQRRPSKPARLAVVPIPCLSTPMSPQILLEELVKPSMQNNTAQTSFQALVPQDEMGTSTVQPITLEYAIDGVLLLVKSACYESGSTPLAAWIPKENLPQFGQALSSAAAQ